MNKRKILRTIGLVMMLLGLSGLALIGARKLRRDLYRAKLIRENAAVEIADLKIKAPVLEGIDKHTLAIAAGHFPGTGAIGSGNYCIAAHNSTTYKEYFNSLKNAEPGMKVTLYTKDVSCTYVVAEMFIVDPSDTWILNDYGDDRLTLVTCTDDGTQRRVVVAKKEG